jgi:F0F1-type ATP synthase membrane subunit b/b'
MLVHIATFSKKSQDEAKEAEEEFKQQKSHLREELEKVKVDHQEEVESVKAEDEAEFETVRARRLSDIARLTAELGQLNGQKTTIPNELSNLQQGRQNHNNAGR